jgi:Flp pilus assembly protein TadD
VKTFALLAAALILAGAACREKPVDVGALVTARTVGLEHLQRGQLAEAEQDFRQVIALAPRDPLGHANLGLTYLRAGRYGDAEAELERARRLDPTNPEVALILAKLYSLTGRPAEAKRLLGTVTADARVLYALAELEQPHADTAYVDRLRRVLEKSPANLAVRLKLAEVFVEMGQADSAVRYLEDVRRVPPAPPLEARPYLDRTIQSLRTGKLADARAALGRFLQLMELTAPYQASLAQVDWVEGPLPGRPVLAFNPASLITMRGIAPASNVEVHFTDVTGESGLPDLRAPVTALALADYDGDGEDNLLVAAPDAHVYSVHGGFVADITGKAALPLHAGLIAATFADYDNDGWLDLFVIGAGANRRGYLLKNRDGKRFEDVTETAGLRDVGSAEKAIFVDVDHDGDLDLLLIGHGSLRVLRNNADGTFTAFPNADGISRGGSDAAFGDFNDDGRIDVALASATDGDALFYNAGASGFRESGVALRSRSRAVAVGDSNNDGILDVFWSPSELAAFVDYDNDGWIDRVVAGSRGVELYHNDGRGGFENRTQLLPSGVQHDSITQLLIADLDRDGDQDILLGTRSGIHLLRNDGGNARLGMRVELSALGMGSGKNNAFGIGAMLQVRAGELYQTRVVTSPVTSFGLGSHFKADVLRVQWPNGVPQTIYFPGTDQDVLEAQQLKGSCAFLYTWDGKRYRFITDVMWRSALGMPLGIMGKGAMPYAPAGASQEYVRIPGEALKEKNGRYTIQVTEELWETAYLDQLRLIAVDHPDSVNVYVDERFPPRSNGLRLYHTIHPRPPRSAHDGEGRDVLDELREHDYRYVSNLTPGPYQGLTEHHDLILDLDENAGTRGTLLVLRGWIFPSDASINVALSQQQNIRAELPTLEVRDASGRWVSRGVVGFPAGKDKTVVIELGGIFPTTDHHVRIRTNLEVYWDHVFVADERQGGGRGGQEATAAVAPLTTLAPLSGDLHYRGFSQMYRRGGRYGPHWFDYDSITTTSPWRPIAGAATRFGDVRPLLDQSDDQYVIMVPGDEATVEFDAPPPPPAGWTRDFLLYSDGWIKDSDLNTADGTTIEPLPYHAITSYPYAPGDRYPQDSARARYQREYNTRVIKRTHGAPEER